MLRRNRLYLVVCAEFWLIDLSLVMLAAATTASFQDILT